MTKIKNMGTSTMKFKEGIIVEGTAGTDTYTLVVTGSERINGDLEVQDIATYNTIEFFNSNTMKFNQYYLGNANGTYFSANEYQKVITIIPTGNSENYQVIGRITAQNAGETHTVYFNAALRSETLPDLSWTILYDEEYNGIRYIDPQLWVKETTTAGFIFAFKTLATIYGNVTVDIDVVPRTSSLKTNVTINNSVSSEQTAVDAGYTAYDMTKVFSKKSQDITLGGDIILPANGTIGAESDASFVKFDETSSTYTGHDMSIGSNQSVHVLLDMNADGATTGGFTVRTGGTTIDASDEVFKFGGDGKIAASKGAVVIEAIETSTYKTLQGTSVNTAVLEDTTFTGLGTNSFTFSCWFYQNDTNSNPVSSNTKVRFLQSSTERHVLNLGVPDVTIQYENASSGLDTADFDTNLASGNWYHVVAHFDVGNLTTGAPRLWIDGQEIAAANYIAVGGTTPNIDRVTIYLDDGAAMQDAVFWDKLLSDSEISELWNNGYYMSPSLHSATGSIASYFLLGQEADLSSFNNGDTLTGEITLTDTAGSGNAFTLTLESEFSILSRTVQEISSPGFEVDSFSIGINRSFTPTSGSDTGKKGEIAWDENYIYVCVATDTWKRTALTSW